MARPERPVDPLAGPVERLAWELRRLRDGAGRPSYRELGRRAHYAPSTLSEAANGTRLPTLEATLAYVSACGGDRDEWEARWRSTDQELDHTQRRCPYPGLSPFEPDDAELFFGRAQLVQDLRGAVAESRFVAVFGASGSGKSSLLRAGLIPGLTAAAVPVAWMTPGSAPMERLAKAYAPLTDEAPGDLRDQLTAIAMAQPGSVLVIDQFEEVFTLCASEAERGEFLDTVPELAATVVIGVRADFYAQCAQHPGLVAALRESKQVPLGPVSDDELRDIITKPAAHVGLSTEPGLVAAVAADASGQPGALPLVAHALRQTWSQTKGETLRLATYRSVGGVRGAIAQTAEELYEDLDTDHRGLLRMILLRLTTLGEGTEDTRRRLEQDELTGVGEAGEVDTVLDRLAAARLVVVDHDAVDLAHEALISAWPRLAGWLNRDREELRLARQLTVAAGEWARNDHQEEFLYRGSRLAGWNGRDLARLNDLELAFLAASRDRLEQEQAATRRRVRLGFGGLGFAAAVVSVLAVLAMVQADRAGDERDRAYSRQLAANARRQLERDPELALLLAARAYEASPTAEADSVLRQATTDAGVRRNGPRLGEVKHIAFSTAGRKLATSYASTVRVWDWDGRTVSRNPAKVIKTTGLGPSHLAFDPDGRRLALGHLGGEVEIVDLTSGDGTPKRLGKQQAGQMSSMAFGPGGRLATGAFSASGGTMRIWDATGKREPVDVKADGTVYAIAFTPDGKRLAAAPSGGPVRVWDVTGDRPRPAREGKPRVSLTTRPGTVNRLAWSPDGKWLGAVTADGVAEIWNARSWPLYSSPRKPALEVRGDGYDVWSLAFSQDGNRTVTTGSDRSLRIWPTASVNALSDISPVVLRPPRGEASGETLAVAFSADGGTLTSVSTYGDVRFWDTATGAAAGRMPLREFPAGEAILDKPLTLTPDGKTLAVPFTDGTIRVWNPASGNPPLTLRGQPGAARRLALRPDGRRLATSGRLGSADAGTLRLWDLASRTSSAIPQSQGLDEGQPVPAGSMAYARDGRLATTGGQTARVWRPDGGSRPLAVLHGRGLFAQGDGFHFAAELSPDGRSLAAAHANGKASLWSVKSRKKPVPIRHPGMVTDLAFSPDGRRLATLGGGDGSVDNGDGTIRVWKTDGSREPVAVLRGHKIGAPRDVTFSPDGRWLASAGGSDGTLRLWRANGGESVELRGFGASILRVAFLPDGQRMMAVLGDKSVRIWRCEVCGSGSRVLSLATRRATRQLTPEERKLFLTQG